MGLDAEIEGNLEEFEGIYSAMEELEDIIESGMDADLLDLGDGNTSVQPERASVQPD